MFFVSFKYSSVSDVSPDTDVPSATDVSSATDVPPDNDAPVSVRIWVFKLKRAHKLFCVLLYFMIMILLMVLKSMCR